MSAGRGRGWQRTWSLLPSWCSHVRGEERHEQSTPFSRARATSNVLLRVRICAHTAHTAPLSSPGWGSATAPLYFPLCAENRPRLDWVDAAQAGTGAPFWAVPQPTRCPIEPHSAPRKAFCSMREWAAATPALLMSLGCRTISSRRRWSDRALLWRPPIDRAIRLAVLPPHTYFLISPSSPSQIATAVENAVGALENAEMRWRPQGRQESYPACGRATESAMKPPRPSGPLILLPSASQQQHRRGHGVSRRPTRFALGRRPTKLRCSRPTCCRRRRRQRRRPDRRRQR